MGNFVVALTGAVGALAVAGGLAALAAGVLALASSWGTSGLGALYLLSLGVLLGGGGAAVLVSGLVLRRAFRTLSALTNSNWAKFQGSATIDGATGVYPFRVDARDGDAAGQTDRFVIKIWAPGADPDTAAPIYKASGDVSGGQIAIHK